MIYSFRPLPLLKRCGWMTYHLTVHTIIMPVNKKTNKLVTVLELVTYNDSALELRT